MAWILYVDSLSVFGIDWVEVSDWRLVVYC